MRLPWIQIDANIDSKTDPLAGLLGVDRHTAKGLTIMLWAWAIDWGPADSPPDGRVLSAKASTIVSSGVRWTGDPELLVSALCDVGLMEQIEGGVRVKGMDRYVEAWTTMDTRKDRAAKWREQKRKWREKTGGQAEDKRRTNGRTSARQTAKTETETETEKKDIVEKRPRQPSAAEAFWKTAQVMAAEKNPLHVAVERSPKDLNIFLKPGIDRVGASGLTLAWTAYLRDEWAAARGWPLEAFAKKWQDLLNSNPKPATATEMRRYDPD